MKGKRGGEEERRRRGIWKFAKIPNRGELFRFWRSQRRSGPPRRSATSFGVIVVCEGRYGTRRQRGKEGGGRRGTNFSFVNTKI
jgi:hypothetical protein